MILVSFERHPRASNRHGNTTGPVGMIRRSRPSSFARASSAWTKASRINRVFAEYPLADRAPVVEAQVIQPVGFMGGHEQEPVPFCLGSLDNRREDRPLTWPAVLVTRGLVGRDRKQQAPVGERPLDFFLCRR